MLSISVHWCAALERPGLALVGLFFCVFLLQFWEIHGGLSLNDPLSFDNYVFHWNGVRGLFMMTGLFAYLFKVFHFVVCFASVILRGLPAC